MQPQIFKAYDIRGLYPEELNQDSAYRIGRALVCFLQCPHVVVGHDMRASSKPLSEALIKGITDQGADVTFIGLCSTPMLYFTAKTAEAAIMITASHNPAQYNGFKFCRNNCIPISGDDGIKDLQALATNNTFPSSASKGRVTKKEVLQDYIQYNLSFLSPLSLRTKPLTIVVDTGNGMGGLTFPAVFKNIPSCKYIPLYHELDGNFPNHEANPIKEENLHDLQQAVLASHADLGIATDGDGDRCILVDENGKTVTADLMTALIAQYLLEKKKGQKNAAILYDLRASNIVPETILACGGTPVMSRVGHSFVKKLMREKKILFGGELAGHFYYQENEYTESTIITTMLLLNILRDRNSEQKPLSELVKPLRKYYHSGEINFEVSDKEGTMKRIATALPDGKLITLDGIKIEYPTWWCSVRASNTEPVLRLIVEAETKEEMETIKARITKMILGS
ncbi:phosphomannomutase/phosphoglucomutase [Candidatus Woesearchaeota archaeon]|nr:phosphomannomutase/phosphoglucomutase [Candidatus Woesearchaeota archaeon]